MAGRPKTTWLGNVIVTDTEENADEEQEISGDPGDPGAPVDRVNLGASIRAMRKRIGITQEGLADRLGRAHDLRGASGAGRAGRAVAHCSTSVARAGPDARGLRGDAGTDRKRTGAAAARTRGKPTGALEAALTGRAGRHAGAAIAGDRAWER